MSQILVMTEKDRISIMGYILLAYVSEYSSFDISDVHHIIDKANVREDIHLICNTICQIQIGGMSHYTITITLIPEPC